MSPFDLDGLAVGATVETPFRTITAERLRWYGDGMLTAAAGTVTSVGANIHTDAEYAASQGFSVPIADGMLATNWISTILVTTFGPAFFTSGELRTKYIKPTYVGVRVKAGFRVCERTDVADGIRFVLDVWTADELGQTLTDGQAAVVVQRSRP